jgi:hypothetical protein
VEKTLCKVFCLTRDEYDLIASFIAYHGALFGAENIVILDNGSTHPDVLAVYKQAQKQGVTVVSMPTRQKPHWKKDALTTVMTRYKDSCDYLIPLDTDEFLCWVDPETQQPHCDAERIHQTLNDLPKEASLFKMPFEYRSLVSPQDEGYEDYKYTCPPRQITNFWPLIDKSLAFGPKSFYRANAFLEGEDGNHHGVVSDGETALTNLGLFHFHHTGAKRCFERARQLMEAHQLVETDAPLLQQLITLHQHKTGHYWDLAIFRRGEYEVFIKRMWIIELFQRAQKRSLTQAELHYLFEKPNLKEIASAIRHLQSIKRSNPKKWSRLSKGKIPVERMIYFDGIFVSEPSFIQTHELINFCFSANWLPEPHSR